MSRSDDTTSLRRIRRRARPWWLARPGWTLLRGGGTLRFDLTGAPSLRPGPDRWQTVPTIREARHQRDRRRAPQTPPDLATERMLAAGNRTPAGWFFSPLPLPVDQLPTAPDSLFVVHIPFGRSGFRVGGRPVSVRMLAQTIRCCPDWGHRPVVLVAEGATVDGDALGSLLAGLAAALKVTVTSSPGPILLGPRILLAQAGFFSRAPGRPDPIDLGRTLPALRHLSIDTEPADDAFSETQSAAPNLDALAPEPSAPQTLSAQSFRMPVSDLKLPDLTGFGLPPTHSAPRPAEPAFGPADSFEDMIALVTALAENHEEQDTTSEPLSAATIPVDEEPAWISLLENGIDDAEGPATRSASEPLSDSPESAAQPMPEELVPDASGQTDEVAAASVVDEPTDQDDAAALTFAAELAELLGLSEPVELADRAGSAVPVELTDRAGAAVPVGLAGPVEEAEAVEPSEVAAGAAELSDRAELTGPVRLADPVELAEAAGPVQPSEVATPRAEPVGLVDRAELVGRVGLADQADVAEVAEVTGPADRAEQVARAVESTGMVGATEPVEPTHQAEVAGAAEPTEMAGAAEPVELTGRPESIEVAGAVGPVGRAELAETVESTEVAGAGGPVESTEVAGTAGPIRLTERAEALGALEPAETAGAAEPVELTGRPESIEVAGVAGPVGRAELAETVESTEVAGVTEPVEPTNRAEATESVELAEPAELAGADNPAETAEVTHPAMEAESLGARTHAAEPAALVNQVVAPAPGEATEPAAMAQSPELVETAERTGAVTQAEAADRADATDPIELGDPAKVAEPAEPTVAAAMAVATERGEVPARAELTGSAEVAEPVQPGESAESTEITTPAALAESSGATAPAGSAEMPEANEFVDLATVVEPVRGDAGDHADAVTAADSADLGEHDENVSSAVAANNSGDPAERAESVLRTGSTEPDDASDSSAWFKFAGRFRRPGRGEDSDQSREQAEPLADVTGTEPAESIGESGEGQFALADLEALRSLQQHAEAGGERSERPQEAGSASGGRSEPLQVSSSFEVPASVAPSAGSTMPEGPFGSTDMAGLHHRSISDELAKGRASEEDSASVEPQASAGVAEVSAPGEGSAPAGSSASAERAGAGVSGEGPMSSGAFASVESAGVSALSKGSEPAEESALVESAEVSTPGKGSALAGSSAPAGSTGVSASGKSSALAESFADVAAEASGSSKSPASAEPFDSAEPVGVSASDEGPAPARPIATAAVNASGEVPASDESRASAGAAEVGRASKPRGFAEEVKGASDELPMAGEAPRSAAPAEPSEAPGVSGSAESLASAKSSAAAEVAEPADVSEEVSASAERSIAAEPLAPMMTSAEPAETATASSISTPLGTLTSRAIPTAQPVGAVMEMLWLLVDPEVPAVVEAAVLPAEPVRALVEAVTAVEPVEAAEEASEAGEVEAGSEQTIQLAPARGDAGKKRVPWVEVAGPATPTDREQVKALLGWRYEAQARAVTGVLALQPGLRAVGGDDLIVGLIAVRAHLAGAGAVVDAVLRGEKIQAEGGFAEIDPVGAELLGRCARAGLSRLPAVVGPVFRAGSADTSQLEQYRSGVRLVEPAFTEARLDPWVPPESTVEYAIWSSTARNTDRMAGHGEELGARVLFSPGTQFVVLDVEQPEGGGPLRVLLRELPPSAVRKATDEAVDERTRERLRDSIRTSRPVTPADQNIPAQWRYPIGIHSDGSLFALASRLPEGTRS